MVVEHVLWPSNMFCGHRTCCMAIKHALRFIHRVVWLADRASGARGSGGGSPHGIKGGTEAASAPKVTPV